MSGSRSADDDDAFTQAVQRLLPRLRGYARSLTRDETTAEDLVQDTAVSAWAARRSFTPGTNLKAWLFRIARNRFLSSRRRSWRAVPWDLNGDDRLLIQAPSQHDGLYRRDLERALEAIPASYRSALNLVTGLGLSYEEAAEQLHIPLGTLRSRVARARAALAAHFFQDYSALPSTGATEDRTSPEPHSSEGSRERYLQWKSSGSRMIG